MKNLTLKLALLSVFGLMASQAMSLGLETLPVTGFAVPSGGAGSHQPTGGTTAYKICNPTGNYGSVTPTLPPNVEEEGSVFDVHSGATQMSDEGTPYALW